MPPGGEHKAEVAPLSSEPVVGQQAPVRPRLEANEAILRARVLEELDHGSRFLEQRLTRLFPGFAGWLLNPLAGMAYRAVGRDEVVRRAQGQFDAVVGAAKLHPERPEAIFDGPMTAYLKHDEAWHRANRAHPRFPELEGTLREVYVARVEAVSALLHRGEGDTYRDLLRSAFPTREHASAVMEREFLYADRILAMAEAELDLLHAPPIVRAEVFRVLREAYAWYRGRMQQSLVDVWPAG